MRVEAEADLRRARIQADKTKMEALNTARREAQEMQLKADLDYKRGLAGSKTELQEASQNAEAIKLQSEVERQLGPQLELQRKHELSLETKQVLAEFSKKGDFNLVGKDGDVAIKSLLTGEIREQDCRQQ